MQQRQQQHQIMVVEDEKRLSIYLQETLKELGYQIAASAVSGEEALSKVTGQKPDLVLMDYKLKGELNGVETARLMRQDLDVPIIFLTAYTNQQMIEEILQAAPFGFLLKPINEKALYTTIEAAITRHQLEMQLKEQKQLVNKLNEELEQKVKDRTHALEVASLKLDVINHELKKEISLRGILEDELRLSLENEKELSELKTRFIATTSHEFRTPLSIILSSSELLGTYAQKWNEEKKKEVFSRIIAAVNHMTLLLEDILFLNKADAGKLEFQPQPVDLKQFLLEIIEEARSTDLSEWLINLTECGPSQPAWIDKKLFHQMLNNLLSNAMKYSPDRQEIEVELGWQSSEFEIKVRDYGIGIPDAAQPKLFESFFRASNVGLTSGTGLGLTIVKRGIDRHGGTISVESTEGKGTTFILTLPIMPLLDHYITLPATLNNENFTNTVKELEQHWWLLERAVEASTTGIIIIDQRRPDRRIIYCNTGFEHLTGYSRDEILGRNYRFLLGEDTAQPGLSEVEAALAENRDIIRVLRNYRKDGTLFLGELNLSPVRDSLGLVVNIIGTIHNVTNLPQPGRD